MLKVKIKKLDDRATIPSYAHVSDAGLDLTAIECKYDDTTDTYVYRTGLAIAIPEGYVGLIFPRSSICKTNLSLSNSCGVIDSGYIGEILFKFNLLNKETKFPYNVGDRIGQLLIIPYPEIEFEEVTELSETERGSNGFGSSGS